jgi:SHS2 domain-containing protein
MKEYDILEHTADVGIRAYGNTLDEAFVHAAKGLFDIITDNSEIKPVQKVDVSLPAAPSIEQLLVDWLSELVFLNGARNLVFGRFDVKITGTSLKATVYGDEYDVKKYRMGTEVKAVTYHMLEVRDQRPYHVQVLLDI